MTEPRLEPLIRGSDTLIGKPGKGLYAFEGAGPISKLRRFAGGLDARHTAEIVFPEAAGAFHPPPLTGPWNLARRLAGVRVAPGSVNVTTGAFTPYGGGNWFWGTTEKWIAAGDIVIDASALGLYLAWDDEP